MVAEIISIGTEILMGNITNTNAVYFARQCAALGIDCYYQDVVGDNEERMTQMIRTALDRSDPSVRRSWTHRGRSDERSRM